MLRFVVNHPAELSGVADTLLDLASATPQPAVIALNGDLGAGKTTFVQALAKLIKAEQVPNSPTFVVMKSYGAGHQLWKKLVHIDAYRLETLDELGPLRFDELLLKKDTIICLSLIHISEPTRPY